MTQKEFHVKVQNSRDTLENWKTRNPVLKAGEFAVVLDMDTDLSHYKLKIGDGYTSFNDLPYFEDSDKLDKDTLGNPNGTASLDENGKIPLWQLPENIGGKPLYTVLKQVPEQFGTLIFNGEVQMPVWRYYDPDSFLISGTVSAKDAGEYIAIFQPAVGYVWEDGTQSPVYCTWEMQKKVVPLPSLASGEFTFTGSLQTPSWNNYNPEELTISGDISGTAAGSYTTIFTPKSNFKWPVGTSDPVEVPWEIVLKQVEVPQQSGVLVYNGNPQTPAWTGYDTDAMTAAGALSGTNADTYTVTFTLKAGHVWKDQGSDPADVEWTIQPKVIETIPSLAKELTYNGSSQSPEWNGYIADALSMSGDLTAVDAGEYATTFTPNPNYIWSQEIIGTLNE